MGGVRMEWISVYRESSLGDVMMCVPYFNKKVLACDGGGRVYIAYRREESKYNEHWSICEDQNCSCIGCTGAISHWMALPEPPTT